MNLQNQQRAKLIDLVPAGLNYILLTTPRYLFIVIDSRSLTAFPTINHSSSNNRFERRKLFSPLSPPPPSPRFLLRRMNNAHSQTHYTLEKSSLSPTLHKKTRRRGPPRQVVFARDGILLCDGDVLSKTAVVARRQRNTVRRIWK